MARAKSERLAGDVSTPRFLYCHGLPGSPGELVAFAPQALAARATALDRLVEPASSYERAILFAFDAAMKGAAAPCVVFGFSLGAMAALRLAAARPAQVERVVLASPAAPLELGEFLPLMAGRAVFEAAARGDLALRGVSALQSLAAAANWPLLRDAMFRGVSAAEREFVNKPAVESAIREGIRQCLGPRQRAYRTELIAYVAPWAQHISDMTCPIEIWQGVADTWTPPAMAEALCAHLGASASLKMCDGLGHYATAGAALGALA